MHWLIPAKTFLLGEYVAIQGGPAIVLTTSPCFKVTLSTIPGLQGIHPESPAGRFWLTQSHVNEGLIWHDPYDACGGLGASGAQFIGAYLATQYLQKKTSSLQELFDVYQYMARQGKGVQSSGYDVLAQSLNGCVYIEKQKDLLQINDWPFQDMGFLLLHTGQKLATHQHLQSMESLEQLEPLSEIVQQGKIAFETKNSQMLIDAVNTYYQLLLQRKLVAEHTVQQIQMLRNHPDVLAVKGCGAMGADILLVLSPLQKLSSLQESFRRSGWKILATHVNLHLEQALLSEIYKKT